jgi:hypothetical protein
MESKDLELINEKMIGIITLLSFIDSKLGILIENTTKTPPYQGVVAQNHYEPINWADND